MPHVSLPPPLADYLGPDGAEVEARTFGEVRLGESSCRTLHVDHQQAPWHFKQGALRTHLVVAVNDRIVHGLDDDFAFGDADRVDVLQAVSGG